MKKSLFVLGLVAFIIASCGEKKKDEVKKEVETVKEDVKQEVTKAVDNLELGKKLFTEKTCATCHQPDAKVIGPSIKDMNKIYAEQNGDMMKFLRGEAAPIVDTDPGQVAIMKANIDGFVKNMTDDELKAIVDYMLSIQ